MSNDEIKYRISVDADDAIKEMGDVAKASDKLLDKTKEGTQVSEQASRQDKERVETTGKLEQELRQLERTEEKHEQQLKQTARASEQVEKQTKEQTQAVDHLNDELREQDRNQEQVNSSTDRGADILGDVKGNIAGMITQWASFSGIAAAVVMLFNDITKAAMESAAAIAAAGDSMRGLAANVGGQLADQVFADVNEVAKANQFGPEQRGQLIEGVATVTDIEEGLTRDQIKARVEGLAKLQHATTRGGGDAARMMLGYEKRFGVGQETAIDQLTTLFNSGFDPAAVNTVMERTGDQDMLQLLLASRQHGMDINKAGRSVNTFLGSIDRREADGQITKSLADLGITEDMTAVQRLKFLSERAAAGEITRGQFEEAVGGPETRGLVGPMAAALGSGAFDQAGEAMRDPDAAERAIADQQASRFVSAADRQRARDMRRQVADEQGAFGGLGEFIDETTTGLKEKGGGSTVLGATLEVGELVSRVAGKHWGAHLADLEARDQPLNPEALGGVGGGTTIIHQQNIIQTQINNGVAPSEQSTGRSGMGLN